MCAAPPSALPLIRSLLCSARVFVRGRRAHQPRSSFEVSHQEQREKGEGKRERKRESAGLR